MRPRRWPPVLRAPEQGWTSLAALLGMLVLLGASVADSRPLVVLGAGSLSEGLPVIMVAAGLIGYLLARSSLGVVRAHAIGAALAAVLLLLVAGAALLGQSPLPGSSEAVQASVEAVWIQLDADITSLVAEEITTPTVTFLVLGSICWTTAQFGAFSVFRYDRGGPAVMAVGTILFLNVRLGSTVPESALLPVLPVLATFSALALLLLMRMQLVQQRFAWARRHISDTQDVSRLFVRTGVAFVMIAVIGASSLTVWATVEAQDVDIGTFEEPLQDFGDELARFLGLLGVPPPADVPRAQGDTTELTTDWVPGDGTAFTAIIESGELHDNYWWGWANDQYDWRRDQWVTTSTDSVEVASDGDLLPAPEAFAGGPDQASVTLTIGDAAQPRANLFRLPDVQTVDRAVVVRKVDDGLDRNNIAFKEVVDEGKDVRFVSFVRDYTADATSLTANELRSAGNAYPEWLRSKYLHGRDDSDVVTPLVQELADEIMDKNVTAYDQALALQNELRAMEYNPTLGDACDPHEAFPECLLTIKEGFCQQYATTMAVVLRVMGIPSRFVTGYLPGTRDTSGTWTVEQQAFHNWVEAYFPGYGWVRFDPTPGEELDAFNQAPTALPPGEDPRPTGSESPEPTFATNRPETPEPDPSFLPVPSNGGEAGGGTSAVFTFLSFAGIAALMLTVIGGLLLFRLRRLPGGNDSLAYRGIVSLATRLGYGPHPSQTEYEYAGTLSEVIPGARDDLYVVTDARVETAYGGRQLDAERRDALRSAYVRIRTALLRLTLRLKR
jgi:hypothetical protein